MSDIRQACANCGHTAMHDAPAGDVADGCSHPGCACGFYVPAEGERETPAVVDWVTTGIEVAQRTMPEFTPREREVAAVVGGRFKALLENERAEVTRLTAEVQREREAREKAERERDRYREEALTTHRAFSEVSDDLMRFKAERDALAQRVEALRQERDETLMLAEHPQISDLRDLARELAYRAQRIIEAEQDAARLREALEQMLLAVVDKTATWTYLTQEELEAVAKARAALPAPADPTGGQ